MKDDKADARMLLKPVTIAFCHNSLDFVAHFGRDFGLISHQILLLLAHFGQKFDVKTGPFGHSLTDFQAICTIKNARLPLIHEHIGPCSGVLPDLDAATRPAPSRKCVLNAVIEVDFKGHLSSLALITPADCTSMQSCQ